MWQQVKEAKDENRHELLIVGKELDKELLSSNGVLDAAIFDLSQLNFLRLAGSMLNSVPDSIGNLKNLTCLELQSNNLSSLPSSIGNLSKLKLFDVSENKLKCFPEEINKLTALTTLNARKNELEEMVSLENCSVLNILDLRMNKLKDLKSICHEKLNSVSELQAAANEIDEIPEEIQCLSNLRNLNLSENSIKLIPSEILLCTKLKEINLKGNPLADRRFRKLVESDRGFSKTVLDYMKQHLKESKGKGDSGKNKKKNAKNAQNDEVDELCDKLAILSAKQILNVKVSAEVKNIRGFLVCCILRNVDLTGTKTKTFLSIQTKLHETICEKRVAATIATHDLAKIYGPLHYCAKSPKNFMIHPLNKPGKMSAKAFLKSLQDEAELLRKQMKRNTCSGIHKYLSLVEGMEQWPCLEDAKGTVISFPPITNAHDTRIESETTDIFVEVTTSTTLKKGKEVMEALIMATLEADLTKDKTATGKKLLTVEQVRVVDEDGNLRLVFPSKTDLAFDGSARVCVVRS